MISGSNIKGKLRLGYFAFGILIAVKVAEYFVATIIRSGAWPYLALLALAGALPIIYYFMHIRQLWRRGRKDDD